MNDNWLKRSVLLRMVIVGALSFGLLIPSFMVMGLISERESARNNAVAEMSEKWGQAQTLTGPILSLPFKKYITQPNGEPHVVVDLVSILPESLSITASATPVVRSRGIYQAVLYSATLSVSGRFSLSPALNSLNIKPENIVWDDARLFVGMSDVKGIREHIAISWSGKPYAAEPAVAGSDVLQSGVAVKPSVTGGNSEYQFSTAIALNGSGDLQFVPVGKETNVSVASSWHSPSFVGRFLPDKRTIAAEGFSAEWKVLHLNRNFPQQWVASAGFAQEDESSSPGKTSHNLSAFTFGVKLLQPVDEYQKATRSAKYAIMFISLTFLAFFLTEVLNMKIVHPIQYVLIGFALILFYALLLSLSEHLAFNTAYWISSGAIVVLVALYARAVLASNRVAVLIAAILAALYGFLFVILQQEDYALLFGSLGLLGILALVMYLTRRLDWFAIGRNEVVQGER
jgi:inner membrane protein